MHRRHGPVVSNGVGVRPDNFCEIKMGKLKLTVNEDKTRICKVPEGEFDFLGYSFGRMYSPRTGQGPLTKQRYDICFPGFRLLLERGPS